MATIAMDVIAGAIIGGIEKAQKDYERMSGGEWLWAAAEYVLTTYIARELDALPGAKFVTVESHGQSAITDAGATVPGPKPRKARLRGRFDVLLWWANSTPRAVIEVKNQPRGQSGWFHDIERITSVLGIGRDSTSMQFGAFAYYYSAVDGSQYSAEEKVLRKLERVKHLVSEKTAGKFRLRQFSSDIYQDGDSAWTAACLLLQPVT
nr:hypothetical protein [Pseudomonas sp. P818]